MFTGIVQSKAPIAAIERNPFGLRLVIDRTPWQPEGGYEPTLGHSISISGVCLTLAAIDAQTMSFDVITETLDKTTLGGLNEGDLVNLEPALSASQPLGGHFVQGHVDGVGEVIRIDETQEEWRIEVQPPASMMTYMIPKGSVAIDGISMTLAKVTDNTFELAVIPTTLEITTLGQRTAGDKVNLEADILTKTIVGTVTKMFAPAPGSPAPGNLENSESSDESVATTPQGLTRDLLVRAGFVK